MNKQNLRLLEGWREGQDTSQVEIDSVKISYKTHLNAIEKGLKYISDDIAIFSDGREIPIVVRANKEEGDYTLLYGLGQLDKINKLGRSHVEAIIVDSSRNGLIKSIKRNYQEYRNVEDIKIMTHFKNSYPSLNKMLAKARLMVKGEIEAVTIDYNSGYLIDGYITYLLLKLRGDKKIKVKLQ